ncbi:MAG: response regulator [Spirochaetales bacterium]|nr:response regulator [Spirochaetales bacterium]
MSRALIVDDSTLIRSIIAEELRRLGHEVAGEAAGGREAVRLFGELIPDLVFMDLALDEIDGLESIRRIRALSPSVRIVVVSALERANVASELQALGVDRYLRKPFTPEDLRAVLAADNG